MSYFQFLIVSAEPSRIFPSAATESSSAFLLRIVLIWASTQIDRWIDRQKIQIDRQIDRYIDRQKIQIDTWIDRKIDRQTDRQTDRQIDRQMDRQRYRQIKKNRCNKYVCRLRAIHNTYTQEETLYVYLSLLASDCFDFGVHLDIQIYVNRQIDRFIKNKDRFRYRLQSSSAFLLRIVLIWASTQIDRQIDINKQIDRWIYRQINKQIEQICMQIEGYM